MNFGLVQSNIIFENKEKNIAKAKNIAKKAKAANIDILFFPEMSFTGFSMNTDVIGESDNETINIMAEVAKENGIALGFGWVYKGRGKAENRYTILNEKGKILSNYTKIHPFSLDGEDRYYNSGNKVTTFEYNGFRICTLICYDLRFPEVFQAASKDADLIVVPANWPDERLDHWRTLLKARAIENLCYIAGINCIGNFNDKTYSGNSSIYNPNGELLISSEKESILTFNAVNDVEVFRKNFPSRRDRKTKLYKKLI